MRLSFNSLHNPRPFTLVLARKDGTKLGTLPAHHLKVHGEMNAPWSVEFSVYKVNNNHTLRIWNEIQDCKLMWIKELDLWYEIHVQTSDGNVCVKSVTATSLAEEELSQTNVYKMEINTETDIKRDDYSPTVFYDSTDVSRSLLDRLLAKTPHYRIVSVPVSLRTIQRSFSFDGSTIYDALQEVAEELECYIDFSVHSNAEGKPDRAIRVYDLKSYCLECRSRGEFEKICSECGSENILAPYGVDMGIFVSKRNLTDEVAFETNKDAIKNCFKLEAGDELMTATAVNCNPNGSSYLWYIPQFMKDDMPQELVEKIASYDELNLYYQDEHIVSPTDSLRTPYNTLVTKYLGYKPELVTLPEQIVGFPALMENYYHTIDFNLLLQSELMPTIETVGTTAAEQASKLTSARISPVAVYSIDYASGATVNSAVLAMAKAQVDYRYQVRILGEPTYSNKVWTGCFTVTNYHDEEDTATSSTISVTITDNYESYVQQMLYKSLANNTNTATDIVTLFGMTDSNFKNELKKYSLNRLQAFYDSCQACINILIEQGCGSNTTWAESDQDLYVDLYVPYQNKLGYISSEISLRESEIATIESVQDEIIDNRNAIQNALNFENYLGTDLWHTFIAYRREDTYSNPNYISDGLNNAQLFERAKQFVALAKSDLYKSANLQHTISSTLKNLLVMKEFDKLLDNFELGNFIHIECDGNVYKIRLLSFDIDFDNLNDLSVTFSDVREIRDDIKDIKDILDNSRAMGSTYDNVKNQASKGKDSRDELDDWSTHGLALTNLKILNSAENQDYVFDEHGMLFRKYQPLLDNYSDEQLKIINSTIAITNDNWLTVKTAIGSHYYVDPETKDVKYAYGINGEVLIGKIILGEKLGIYNSGSTLKFNKDGLFITNGLHSFSVNPNNKESLLNIKKHYADGSASDIFKISDNGLYMTGEIVATSGYIGGKNGWTIKDTYIYNGKTALKNEQSGVYIGIDGIGLGAGKFYVDSDGYFVAENGEFNGKIKGGTININDNFIVDEFGNVSLNGNIIWGTGASPTQVVYARTSLTKPEDDTSWSSFPSSSSTGWHKIYESNDYYASFTYDGGKTWGTAIQVVGKDGINGSNGSNGSTIQIVYLYYRTSTFFAPSKPSYTGGTLPSGWSLSPTGVSSSYKYEFISQCTVTNGEYGSWSNPVLWAKYGANGSNGSDAAVTDQNVFNALTSNGTMYGCFTAVDDKLYINAAYIRAGTISSNITITGKLIADNAEISGNISATSGYIGGWYIGVNDGYLRTAEGTYGTYKWGDGAVYTATGYCFVALTPKGVIFVLKSGSDYDASSTIVETSSWISSSSGSTTPGGGTIEEL